jgi:hypothetical protein
MPTSNGGLRKLQCPFCATISARGTGLSSHIRSQHPREYGKWSRNPNKIGDAAAAALPARASAKASPVERGKPRAVGVTAEAKPSGNVLATAVPERNVDAGGNDAGRLVEKAYHQLTARKQSIEAELARIDTLRAEHETVTARLAALEEAMKTFQK